MAWPSSAVPTTNLDSGGDSPAAARPDLLAAVQAVNSMMTEQLPPAQGGVPTGAGMDYFLSTAPTGWIFAWGTIGNATSGATNRANADCQALFEGLWNSMADAQAPVSGGRGASSAADWAAGKTIAVPDKRGRVSAGRDDMGGTAAGRLTTTLTGTRAATTSGVITGLSSTAGLTIGMAASGTGIGTGAVISSIDSTTQVTLSVNSTSTGSGSIVFGVLAGATLGATGGAQSHTLVTAQMPAHNHTFTAVISTGSGGASSGSSTSSTGTTSTTGGGQAHPNLQPTIVVNYIIKL